MTTATATRTRKVPAWMSEDASGKQIALVESSLTRKVVPADLAAEVTAALEAGLTKGDADRLIPLLVACKWAPKAGTVKNPVTEIGMYSKDGEVYRVVKARYSDRLYAKRLVIVQLTDEDGAPVLTEAGTPRWTASLEFDGAAIHRLQATDRMTSEQASAIGLEFGICCNCAAILTDPASIARGIGPVCANKV